MMMSFFITMYIKMHKNRLIKYKIFSKALMTLCILSVTNNIVNADTNILKDTVYEKVGIQENVDPYLLYSISLVESAKAKKSKETTLVAPHKYAIRTPRGAIYPKTYFEAVEVLDRELKTYSPKSIDIGLMQINGQHFSRVASPAELLKPDVNVKVACDILKTAMDSYPGNKTIGIGRYHSFTDWRARAYGSRVIAVYKNLKGQ